MLVTLPEPITLGALYRQFTTAQGEINAADTVITSFTSNSKEVVNGTLFIACRGVGIDGHSFIDSAFSLGAAAVVVGNIEKLNGRAGFEVSNARVLLSRLSAFAFAHPSRSMRVIGITGTNGKTTTNWIIYHALILLGEKCVRIGTLGYEISEGKVSQDTLTTPSPEDLHRILAMALSAGCSSAVIEISSHALHQHRADDISLDAAVFTNITHDHLDYHRTFDGYLKAKKRIFDLLRSSQKPKRVFCVNLDSHEGLSISKEFATSFEVDASFGNYDLSAVKIIDVQQGRSSSQIRFEVDSKEVTLCSSFLGRHNAENMAAALGVLKGLGYPLDAVLSALSQVPPVPGRLEPVEYNGIATFVDYAHTPDALERVLTCLKQLPHNRLLLVFGCGGDRDWRKRSSMGSIAARLADYVIVTSDNPRKEDPNRIIADILEGELLLGSNCEVIADRAQAIKAALLMAVEKDLVLIAGKGHEDYQIIGDVKHYFSDQQEIKNFFAKN